MGIGHTVSAKVTQQPEFEGAVVQQHHTPGQIVEVLIAQPFGKDARWSGLGVVDAITPADDRPYRVSVRGEPGTYYRACAPECVRRAKVAP